MLPNLQWKRLTRCPGDRPFQLRWCRYNLPLYSGGLRRPEKMHRSMLHHCVAMTYLCRRPELTGGLARATPLQLRPFYAVDTTAIYITR